MKENNSTSPTHSDFWQAVRVNAKLQHKSPVIKPVSRHGKLLLSFAQERLWFIDQLQPDNTMHNLRAVFQLKGPLNITILEQSLQAIEQRHEILRTTFPAVDEQPVQTVLPDIKLTLPIVELGEFSIQEREAEVRRLAIKEAQQPFDLASGPLVRFKLLRLNQEEHIFLLTSHHIINDRWSTSLFMRELAVHYRAFLTGKSSPLPKLPIQYADFAQFQRGWLRGKVLDAQLDYWKQQLNGELPLLQLPTDHPAPAIPTYQGASQYLELPGNLVNALKRLGQQEGVSLFVILLAAFKALLYQYSGQQDIIICSPVAGRYRVETKNLIGYFSNVLLLRTYLGENPSFTELVARVSKITLTANEYQDLPLQQLVDILNMPNLLLSRTMFALQNVPSQPLELASDVSVTPLDIEEGIANFDLFLSMKAKGEAMLGVLRYKTDLFGTSTIKSLLGNFHILLEQFVANPQCHLSDLPQFSTPANLQTSPLHSVAVPYVEPQNETEQKIASVWKTVLHREKIGIHDNFYDLGGRSLTILSICKKLEAIFDRNIAVAELFKHLTIAEMAQFISKNVFHKELDSSLVYNRTQKQKAALARQKQLNKTRRLSNGS
ncbi:condensation domain-containing protein [Deltaproteobacteria bacterium TL4]